MYEKHSFIELLHFGEMTAALIAVLVPGLAIYTSLAVSATIEACVSAAMGVETTKLLGASSCTESLVDFVVSIIVTITMALGVVWAGRTSRPLRERLTF